VEHCIKKLVKTQRAVVHHVSVANCGLTGLALLSFEASCAAQSFSPLCGAAVASSGDDTMHDSEVEV